MTWVNADLLLAQDPPPTREINEVMLYRSRRAKARFHADENFPIQAIRILRDMGAQVRTTRDVGRTGHPDENHAAYALRNGFVLVTCDRDFLDNRSFPIVHCPAIFVFDFGSGNSREMRQAFRCLSWVFRTPQFFDKWWKIDARRDCWTQYVRFQNGTTSRSRYRFWRGRLQEWVEDGLTCRCSRRAASAGVAGPTQL